MGTDIKVACAGKVSEGNGWGVCGKGKGAVGVSVQREAAQKEVGTMSQVPASDAMCVLIQ